MLVRLHLLLAELVLSMGGPCQISQDVVTYGLLPRDSYVSVSSHSFPQCVYFSRPEQQKNYAISFMHTLLFMSRLAVTLLD